MICHSADQLGRLPTNALNAEQISGLKALGLLGVEIFFALSGFLITSRLLDEETKRGSVSLRNFYIRRAFRILPAAFGFLIIAGCLAWIGILPITAGRWLSAAFFLANYSTAAPSWYLGHLWSLAVEEHFYLIWPLLYITLKTPKGRLRGVLLLIALQTIWRAVAFKYRITYSDPAQFWGRSDIVADDLLYGVAGALIFNKPGWWASVRSLLVNRISSVFLLITILAITLVKLPYWKIDMLLHTVKGAAIPLLIGGTVLRAQYGMATLLESRAMKWLGRLSYSLYLWQQLFLVWDESLVATLRPLQQIPLSYLCSIACAYSSYRFLERPLIRLGRRVSNGTFKPS
jgi:peptidoglycan/LPS O-acetylase OafA/YrhL